QVALRKIRPGSESARFTTTCPVSPMWVAPLPHDGVLLPSEKEAMPMPNDMWRDVAGFPGYQVSRAGEVFSLKRNRLLSPAETKKGYLAVNLYRDGKPKNLLVHRLVAAAFIGPIPVGYVVNHRNGCKTDCRSSNLEICTPKENSEHAKRHGLIRSGERNARAKLTAAQVRTIRRLRREGMAVRD